MAGRAPEALWQRLNGETARIGWPELLPHFARGVLVQVAPEMDLVAVAAGFAEDDRARVEGWLACGAVRRASDDDARRWNATQPTFWAVVTAPWVLIQEIRLQ